MVPLERFAPRIARAVVRERDRDPFTTSGRLVELVRDNVPAAARRTGVATEPPSPPASWIVEHLFVPA